MISTGPYIIRVSGDVDSLGTFAVSLVVNAALENESHGGLSNSDPTTAQAIDGSSIAVGAGNQLSVVGRSGDADVYSIQLTAGQTVSAGLKLWQPISVYGPRSDYDEYTPTSVALGDVNNDGIPDMVDTSYQGWYLTVRLGNGDGTFGLANTFGSGSYQPTKVVLADVNGDGNLDAISANNYGANYGGGSVTVMIGHGDGVFDAATSYYAGYSNWGVAVEDVNGDGKPDIVTTNNDWYSAVNVLMNNGDGTFAPTSEYFLGWGYYPRSVTLADLNGDGRPEIITSNDTSYPSLTVLFNNGDGTFASQMDLDGGGYSGALAADDINRDGAIDLVATNFYNGTVSVLLNNGNGTFAGRVAYDIGAYSPIAVALVDVNGDDKLDIVTAAHYSGMVSVLFNNGDGSFVGLQSTYSAPYPNDIAVGDLNGDGRPDLVTPNVWSYSLSVFLYQSAPYLELIAPDQTTVLATSSSAQDYDAVVDFAATEEGTYYVRISDVASLVDYTLVVTRNTDLPVPPSGSSPALLASSPENPVGDGNGDGSGLKVLGTSDAAHPWFNPVQAVDVNNDGYVSPIDALLLINSLNAEGSRSLPKERSGQAAQAFYDVNRDGFISPIDPLQVINYLNDASTGKAEVLPSGDPAAALPMTAQESAKASSITANVPPAAPQTGAAVGRLFHPLASGFVGPAARATFDASINVDLLHDPHQDWILGAYEPAIGALADDSAGKSDLLDNWREQLFSAYGRRRPDTDL